jgi:DNA (cytosine-5)-methyltransferase 1
MQNKKTIGILCSGFDLMGVGAMHAGLEPIWSIELDPRLAEVAAFNLCHQVYMRSVIGFEWSKLDRPDHLHISPPCQNASIANAKAGETALDLEIARSCCEAIRTYLPESFTLENVRGYQKFKGFQEIINCLWGLQYWVNVDLFNAADFGVPQSRERVIVRAAKNRFSAPISFSAQKMGWYEAIEDLIPSLEESTFAEWQLKLMPEIYATALTDSATNTKAFPFPFLVNGTANNRRDVTVRNFDKPSFTITASQAKRPLRSWIECGRIVALNPRSIARLQTLPDWYELPDSNALAGIGIGNGVPCLMAQRILESLS